MSQLEAELRAKVAALEAAVHACPRCACTCHEHLPYGQTILGDAALARRREQETTRPNHRSEHRRDCRVNSWLTDGPCTCDAQGDDPSFPLVRAQETLEAPDSGWADETGVPRIDPHREEGRSR